MGSTQQLLVGHGGLIPVDSMSPWQTRAVGNVCASKMTDGWNGEGTGVGPRAKCSIMLPIWKLTACVGNNDGCKVGREDGNSVG